MRHRGLRKAFLAAALFRSIQGESVRAENGYEAVLRYAPVEQAARERYMSLPPSVVVLSDSAVLAAAREEMIRGVKSVLGGTLRAEKGPPRERSIILGTFESIHAVAPDWHARDLREDGFWLTSGKMHGVDCFIIASPTERGVLYGAFALLSKIARNESINALDEVQRPHAPIRWADQWDNLDGRIERGYGGPSIFFENGTVRTDLSRVADYARLLASVGINGCAINNVNADPRI